MYLFHLKRDLNQISLSSLFPSPHFFYIVFRFSFLRYSIDRQNTTIVPASAKHKTPAIPLHS